MSAVFMDLSRGLEHLGESGRPGRSSNESGILFTALQPGLWEFRLFRMQCMHWGMPLMIHFSDDGEVGDAEGIGVCLLSWDPFYVDPKEPGRNITEFRKPRRSS
ncbi:hypothetical protein Nepgr_026666 [Nepenthes gracilis]|uniref:Uncharacterized protein n=1 Tax=Nepenthes gracilis TaxID=150966 RepID=A0AAD3Y0S5_NEPGR|nr:hypothetical protein Nepgr_026666 [Nepenthes gracilis]